MVKKGEAIEKALKYERLRPKYSKCSYSSPHIVAETSTTSIETRESKDAIKKILKAKFHKATSTNPKKHVYK